MRGVSIGDHGLQNHSFEWMSVERILAFKVDLLTTDEVALEFIAGGRSYIVGEDTDGWSDLLSEISRRYPILTSWFENVLQPPFATNLGIVWDRSVNEAVLALSAERVEELWQLAMPDFCSDGALRDIYVHDTTEAEWNAMLAVARGMFAPVLVTAASGPVKCDLSPQHYTGKQRAQIIFNVGPVEIIGHCFDVSTIELG